MGFQVKMNGTKLKIKKLRIIGILMQYKVLALPKKHSYDVDKDGKPTFDEIKNLEHKELCIKAYEENIVYYRMLIGNRLKR